ncbi:MAG TPA: hypothetical protein IAD32_04615 [Candidatus Scatavimonas merdigallinarum]|uniref:Uncharacterized protein n=1 Tax=Candidatus Scatavimonas merdigallinarum TaxID=2840914 RepID=A0A9D0ZI09_9FIRM|nr:hypothetical protein [Candidatus Scatavimonas merdigallinarum]
MCNHFLYQENVVQRKSIAAVCIRLKRLFLCEMYGAHKVFYSVKTSFTLTTPSKFTSSVPFTEVTCSCWLNAALFRIILT